MSVVSPEGKVKLYIKKFMKAHFPNAWQYCPMGGPFGKSGVPDFLYLIEGILIGIEAKADKGRLSELQAQTLKQMAAQGALCAETLRCGVMQLTVLDTESPMRFMHEIVDECHQFSFVNLGDGKFDVMHTGRIGICRCFYTGNGRHRRGWRHHLCWGERVAEGVWQ